MFEFCTCCGVCVCVWAGEVSKNPRMMQALLCPPREEDVPVRGTGEQSRGSGKETRRAGTSDGGFQPRVAGSYNVALYRPARAHSSAGRLGKLTAGVLPIDYIPWPADNNTDLPNSKSNSWKTRFLLRGCIKKRFFLRKNSARGEG